MPATKDQDEGADAGRRDHPRRQAGQPPDRRRPGLRRAGAGAADPRPLPPRPDARPAARVEGQGRTRRRGPRRRRPARSTSRRRSTRGSSSRTCAAPPTRPEDEPELTLFDYFDGLDELDLVDFYQHQANWSNRMILGDSLNVMASLAEREALRGKVQMIYIDPPYGIKFGTNWQVVHAQARRQGRQARGRVARGRADQGLPRHMGARDPLVPHVPAGPAGGREGSADRERVGLRADRRRERSPRSVADGRGIRQRELRQPDRRSRRRWRAARRPSCV